MLTMISSGLLRIILPQLNWERNVKTTCYHKPNQSIKLSTKMKIIVITILIYLLLLIVIAQNVRKQ